VCRIRIGQRTHYDVEPPSRLRDELEHETSRVKTVRSSLLRDEIRMWHVIPTHLKLPRC
jgi:hypothetical protein